MSRNTGTFNFAANFEVLAKAPLDAKQLVGTKADLTGATTWNQSGQVWLYDGAIVAVGSDPVAENNGIYWLSASTNYTNINSWVKVGSGTGTGTITGGTNGLSTAGANVVLGGDLIGNTTIDGLGLSSLYVSNINGFDVSTSGNTAELIIEPAGITLSFSGTSVSLDSNAGLTYATHYTFNEYSLVDKQYVDNIATGLLPKEAVCAATTGATDFSYPMSGLTIIDGVQTTEGMRILVKDPSPSITNGIWLASASGWTRAGDFDGTPSGETVSGAYVWVLSGNTNKDTSWVVNTPDPLIVHDPPLSGDTPLNFVLYNHVQDVQSGNAGIVVNAVTGIHYVCLDNTAMCVRANGITGATNGLSKVGSHDVKLGGTLCENTTILNPSYTLFLSGSCNSDFSSVIQSPYTPSYDYLDQTIISQNCDCVNLTAFHLSHGRYACITLSAVQQSANTNTVSIFGSGAQNTNSDISLFGENGIAVSGCSFDFHTYKIKICNANALTGGTTSDSLLVWDSDDFKVKSLAISAITSGITGTITGGTNGLGEAGKDVCLGGSLLNNTTINPAGYDLNISGTTGSVITRIGGASNYGYSYVLDNCVGIGRTISSNYAYIDITGTTITTNSQGGNLCFSTNCRIMITAPTSGATYAGDYEDNFTARSLVTKQYVDNKSNLVCVCIIENANGCEIGVDIDLNVGYLGVSGATGCPAILLPLSPSVGQRITIADVKGDALTNPIWISGNTIPIMCNATGTINTCLGSITFIYTGVPSVGWSATAFVN